MHQSCDFGHQRACLDGGTVGGGIDISPMPWSEEAITSWWIFCQSSPVPRAPDLRPGQEAVLLSEGALSIWAHTATCMGVLLGRGGAGPGVSLHWLHLSPFDLMKSKSWHFLSFTGRIGRQQHHFWPWYQCPLPLQFREMCSIWIMYVYRLYVYRLCKLDIFKQFIFNLCVCATPCVLVPEESRRGQQGWISRQLQIT